jgi:hypothetical protein
MGKMEEYNRLHPDRPITEDVMSRLIFKPDFTDVEDNRLRRELLWPSRGKLLAPTQGVTWLEKKLEEDEFNSLRVIRSSEWVSLSNFCGSLEIVAERAYEERTTYMLNEEYYERQKIEAINKMADSGALDLSLILLRLQDSQLTTILEGNHTAAAFYIKCYLKKETVYR